MSCVGGDGWWWVWWYDDAGRQLYYSLLSLSSSKIPFGTPAPTTTHYYYNIHFLTPLYNIQKPTHYSFSFFSKYIKIKIKKLIHPFTLYHLPILLNIISLSLSSFVRKNSISKPRVSSIWDLLIQPRNLYKNQLHPQCNLL